MSDALDTVAPKIPYGRADFRGMRLDGGWELARCGAVEVAA